MFRPKLCGRNIGTLLQRKDVSMFRPLYIPTKTVRSEHRDVTTTEKRLYVPTSLCSDLSMFRPLYIPTLQCVRLLVTTLDQVEREVYPPLKNSSNHVYTVISFDSAPVKKIPSAHGDGPIRAANSSSFEAPRIGPGPEAYRAARNIGGSPPRPLRQSSEARWRSYSQNIDF